MKREEAATWATSWQTTVVPGLLPTRAYRRALTWALLPNAATAEADRQLDRQLDRRRVGSSAVIAEQIAHPVELSEAPGVEIRVVPLVASSPNRLRGDPWSAPSTPVES
ncbi:Scr1 family TA system antitoxin-like transcriptional regulator [Nocardia jinanensis]|uniref:DUF5753 domain-containing protein n=1 Tax=Nocardia jinanensis TaxID=382504 RepID=A0A917R6E0_9NOCA|nr:Scr1 family TA system antitoxin-like transcriptional regulator [Nocardia jinanensis]GGK92219.1 hypothetical protein GCM10011588_03300 [Nocardia jinanensis]